MKFAAGITLYNPTDEEIVQINRYLDVFEYVFVYDNSSDNRAYIGKINKEVRYCFNQRNDGLCIAFNHILDICNSLKIDFLCTLDQDSIFKSKDIINMKKYVNQVDIENIGIISPQVIFDNKKTEETSSKNVNFVICSGAFLNLKNINSHKIRYDDNYFLDRFDADICKNIILHNLKIIVYAGSKLYQRLGEYTICHHAVHSSIRHYYISRNRLYYNQKYYYGFTKINRDLLQTIKHIFLIVFAEPQKLSKLKMVMFGLIDYHHGKLGKRCVCDK